MASIIAVSSVTKKSFEEVSLHVPSLTPVHGRMTIIDKGQPFEVIIDYAHTPSSFETIFPSIRKRCKGRLIALFGSGGERDVQKRAQQGQIASRYCDIMFFTDEDPRFEDSNQILQNIAEGAQKSGKTKDVDYFLIPNRPEAIRQAFKKAQAGDIVLLLGKAHENSIIYKDVATLYDELTEAQNALSEMGF